MRIRIDLQEIFHHALYIQRQVPPDRSQALSLPEPLQEPALEESAKQTENIVEPKKTVTFANDNVPLKNEEVNQIILDTDRKASLEEKNEPQKTDEVNEENKEINID